MSEERDDLSGTEPVDDDFDEEVVDDEPVDEPEGEPTEPVDEEPEEPRQQQQQRRPGRRERLQAEVRELRERSDRLERELRERSQQTQPQRVDPAEQARRDQAEAERVGQLPYDQQMAYWRAKDRAELSAALQQHQLFTANTVDRTSFEAAARVDPVRGRMLAEVEALVAAENAAGRYPTREQTFYYLLGQQTDRARRSGRTQTQRRQAQQRVARQQTRPAGAGSDVARGNSRPAADSYEASLARLSGKQLW
jgi:hypothetical protein